MVNSTSPQQLLSCTSPVGLTSVNDTWWNQTGSANSSTTLTALAFRSHSAAVLHKTRVPSLAQKKCDRLYTIAREPVWPQGCFCTALRRMILVMAGTSTVLSSPTASHPHECPTSPVCCTEQRYTTSLATNLLNH